MMLRFDCDRGSSPKDAAVAGSVPKNLRILVELTEKLRLPESGDEKIKPLITRLHGLEPVLVPNPRNPRLISPTRSSCCAKSAWRQLAHNKPAMLLLMLLSGLFTL